MKKQKKLSKSDFRRIIRDIKSVKIQGARNIAKAALLAYYFFQDKKSEQMLINARPTEPMLKNTLENFKKLGYGETLSHFNIAQKNINSQVITLIKNKSVIFTHCHSTNVINSLIYAHKNGKKFQ